MAVKQATKSRSKIMGRSRKDIDNSTYQNRCAIRLRELMDRKGWTPDDLVTNLMNRGHKASINTIYSYLSGDRAIPLDLVPSFADMFGIAVRTFFPEE